MRWRSADKAAHFKRFSLSIGSFLMHADTAVNLIMNANLFIELIIITIQLNTVHPQIGVHNARLVWIFGIHLRQCDKSATILRPMCDQRKIRNTDFLETTW
ncbi:hypothetical protein D3C71_1509620 [compost metagenome]